MTLETWLAFTAASAVLLVIPGPTILLVVSYALGQGWRTALPMAVGVALGDFTAMTLSLLGFRRRARGLRYLVHDAQMVWCRLSGLARDQALARRRGASMPSRAPMPHPQRRCWAMPGSSRRSTRRA